MIGPCSSCGCLSRTDVWLKLATPCARRRHVWRCQRREGSVKTLGLNAHTNIWRRIRHCTAEPQYQAHLDKPHVLLPPTRTKPYGVQGVFRFINWLANVAYTVNHMPRVRRVPEGRRRTGRHVQRVALCAKRASFRTRPCFAGRRVNLPRPSSDENPAVRNDAIRIRLRIKQLRTANGQRECDDGLRQQNASRPPRRSQRAQSLGLPSQNRIVRTILTRSLAVEGLQGRPVYPVVRVDEEDVVARLGDPAETRLPPELARDGIKLQAVHQRDEWIELRVDVVEARRAS